MTEFDKMMKDNSDKVHIPDGFDNKVKDVLDSLPERDETKKRSGFRLSVLMAAIIIVAVAALGITAGRSDANIIDTFKMTLKDILYSGEGEGADGADDKSLKDDPAGIESNTESIKAKRDLMIELNETIIDSNGIYALVQITAPSDVELDNTIGFDYCALCQGTNYSADNLIGGAISCDYFEGTRTRPNVALYVVKFTGDISEYEGKDISVCLKDLTRDPNGEEREVLVEGMWSASFVADKTVRDSVAFTGDEEIDIPYINSTATIEELELTPLGISLTANVSGIPFDQLGVSDTTISLKLIMADGEELIISPYDEKGRYIVESGESEFDQVDGISYQKDIYSFTEAVDINSVMGVYVQGVFVPVN